MNIVVLLCLTVLAGIINGTCVEKCQLCTLQQLTPTGPPSPWHKPFTSDTIDNSGNCAVRTTVCDSNGPDRQVMITYNGGDLGTDQSQTRVTSVLTCNDNMKWVKTANGQDYVITSIECDAA